MAEEHTDDGTVILSGADKLNYLGWYFGYPLCCIENFVQDVTEGRIPAQRNPPIEYKGGFIPCDTHAQLIYEGKMTIEELVGTHLERRCPTPFPDDSGMYEDMAIHSENEN